MKTIIYNGKIITGDNIIPVGYIGIEDGVISEIGIGEPPKKPPIRSSITNAHWIDAEGDYISPGFIDLHVHGVGVCDLYKDPVKGLKKMSRILASQGVTSFLPTLITAPIEKIIETISSICDFSEKIPGANILGINLEGPYINPEKKGAHPLKYIRTPNVAELKSIIDSGKGKIKLVTMAPELQGVSDLISLLKKNKIILAMGHTMASYEQAVSAIDSGFNYVTHFFNAMTPFHHRAPGIICEILIEKEVIIEIIADGVHLHPGVVKLMCQLRDRNKIVLITDALIGIMRKGDRAEFADTEVISNGICAYNEMNELMGSVTPMNKAIQNITQFTDLNLTQAIKLATINPANVIGVGDKKGSIEVGKDADIIILGDDIIVKTTIIDGKVI